MLAVSGSSARMPSAMSPLMPGRLISIRMTSGRAARAISMPRMPSFATNSRISGRRSRSFSTNIKFAGLSSTHSSVCSGASGGRARRYGRLEFRRRRDELRRMRRVQFDPEHAAHADRAFGADFPAHQFDQPLAHHQADARSLLAAGLLPEAIEGLEQLGELFRRQSIAGIMHADARALVSHSWCKSLRPCRRRDCI